MSMSIYHDVTIVEVRLGLLIHTASVRPRATEGSLAVATVGPTPIDTARKAVTIAKTMLSTNH